MINAHRDEIAFVKNTSEGLAMVAGGIDWKPGDRIVTTGVEYPANIYPWMEVQRRFGVELVMVPEESADDGSRRVPLDKILLAADHPQTKLVTLSHVEFASGQRHDLAAVGAFCRSRGTLFCIDGIQSIGVVPVDVQAMQVDYLSADGHKWMLGPNGAGIFYCREELLDRTHPLTVGAASVVDPSRFGDYNYTLRPGAARLVESGDLNVAGLLALRESIRLLTGAGIDAVAQRMKTLGDRLIGKLRAKGYHVASPRTGTQWSGIVSATSPVHDPVPIARELREKHRVEIAVREGRLRFSPHFYNTEEQLDRAVDLLPGH
jgi:cysteine desulfurase / selenocysteine lyase